jgi:hypothetical protein
MTPRDRRALAVGGTIALVAVIFLRVLPGIAATVSDRRHRLEAESALLARTEAELDAAAQLEDSAAVVKAALERLAPKLLAGNSETDAAADLVGQLGRQSTLRRVRLERTHVVADTVRAGWLSRITVSAQVEGDLRGIAGFLAEVASGPPVIVAERVRVVASTEPNDGGPERLRLELVARGWYLTKERSQ